MEKVEHEKAHIVESPMHKVNIAKKIYIQILYMYERSLWMYLLWLVQDTLKALK